MLEVSFVGFSILLGLLMLFDFIEGNPDLYLQEISANRSMFIGITLLGIMNIVHVFLGAKAFLTKKKKGAFCSLFYFHIKKSKLSDCYALKFGYSQSLRYTVEILRYGLRIILYKGLRQ